MDDDDNGMEYCDGPWAEGWEERSGSESPSVTGLSCAAPERHQLEYSIWSNRVSWCPICMEHFYNDTNKVSTTEATPENYHELGEAR